MRMRAAVLEEFGAPLAVQEIDLAEPKAGEVLVRLVACGVCHTDMYTASGADPSGYAPPCSATRARASSRRSARACRDLAAGDHVVTLFSPQCRECVHCLEPADEPLPGDPRRSRTRATCPTAPRACRRDGEPIRHFMGTSTFAEYTVMPEIALAKVSPEAPLDRACLFACGLSTGLGAAMFTAKVEAGLDLRRVRRRAWSASAPWRAAGCRAPSGSSASTCPRTGSSWPAARARPTRWIAGEDTVAAGPRRDRRLRRRLHVRGDRPRRTSCARRSSPRAWAGACARWPAWPARARRSTSSRAS